MYRFYFILITFIFSIFITSECAIYKHKDLSFYKPSILSPNNELFNKWINFNTTTALEYYFFNFTNLYEFLRFRGTPVKSAELNPYLLVKETETEILNYSEDGDLVYIKYDHYYPDDNGEFLKKIRELKDELVQRIYYFFDDFLSKDHTQTSIVYTGKSEWTKYGEIKSMMGETSEYCWRNSFCSRIYGAKLNFYNLEKTKLTYYSDFLSRPLEMIYKKDSEFKGIKVKRYEIDESNYDMNLEKNKCYCADENLKINGKSICSLKGILGVSKCDKDVSLLSFPHFLNASPELITNLTGLQPNMTKHTSFLDFDPITGIILNYSFSFQLNNFITLFDLIVPEYYLIEKGEISDEKAALFYEIII